ncbi:MAG: DEAD/DEAH box helicase family protein [Synergistaceae bacterium]|nr:DEAD/DEAH box helicase family protein [Synergistaceae bacterium]
MTAKIDRLIINSPYEEPKSHWVYDHEAQEFQIVEGRRKAGYFVAKPGAKKYDDEGRFIEIELVNRIRERVRQWRDGGYQGITNTTRDLLSHWHDESARPDSPFFFCQLDAIETLIFLYESLSEYRSGILIQDDGSEFRRLCTKLCTGGGKTIVMAMLIAWQISNSVSYPRDKRFTRNILIVAPNLTVKKRLQVLLPDSSCENYYSRFQVMPPGMNELLNQGNILIRNWQALEPEKEDTKSVDKRGPKSDNAYCQSKIGDMKNILVINDEAHHAYRLTPENKKGKSSEEKREATVWIQSLDRIHRARKITCCYDFSATPFVMRNSRGKDEEGLFTWIVSDFGLSDGIESGLVKTPRIVVRDNAVPDSETYKSKFYHIYADPSVKENLNSSSDKEVPLPDLVTNAYMMLGLDWKEVYDEWKAAGRLTPPVMITVANTTETAARIEYAFTHDAVMTAPELKHNLLRIDSKVLDGMNTEEAARLRDAIDNVGKEGTNGEQIRNVISVGMLSEGWDARTVTHIMGLRAFTSQLLCEQVVGRGLRRTSYDVNDAGMFSPEYVNVFGIPFAFLPHEDSKKGAVPTKPTIQIKVLPEREEYKISWPEVLRLEYVMRETLSLDVDSVPEIELDAAGTRISADLAPVIDGKMNLSMCSDIDLEKLYGAIRMQRMIFDSAGRVYDLMLANSNTEWQKHGTKLILLGQVIKLTEDYLSGGQIKVTPELFMLNETRRKIIIALNMERIITHIWSSIKSESTEKIIPVINNSRRERSTGDMLSWYTSRPCHETIKSHISHCVYDSALESSTMYALEHNANVKSYAKNDHLGFYVNYVYKGQVKRYVPDFFVRLKNNITLILETKGIESEQDKEKKRALSDWIKAVNNTNRFGEWACDMSKSPADIDGIIAKYI